MSKLNIEAKPVQIPESVEFQLTETAITIKGPLGNLVQSLDKGNIKFVLESGNLQIGSEDTSKATRALIGTLRSLIMNMITGVTQGFEKKLLLVGVGYRAQASGSMLNMNLGYSHPVEYEIPKDLKVETPTPTEIVLKGLDKQLVGQAAADIRSFRKPEPYKGKGIRYADEYIRIKETKKK